MENAETPKKRRRIGWHRWLIIVLVIINAIAVCSYSPILPHIQVPPEPITLLFGDFYLTNTLVATMIADVLLILAAFFTWRATRRGESILTGIAGIMELLVEGLYNMVESTAGKHARRIFPWVATIILVVLVANWMEVFPGVDSVGAIHELHEEGEGYPIEEVLPGVYTILDEELEEGEHGYHVLPYVRVASTDLNFTLALALTSVIMTQVIGLQALGISYLRKFFSFGGVVGMWIQPELGIFDIFMPLLDLIVGLLELVAEFAKILSFSFRLFGNIFAGSVLLFVIGTLIPVFVQSGVLLFEIFVGVIQAAVFGMLTLVFMTMAVASHEEH